MKNAESNSKPVTCLLFDPLATPGKKMDVSINALDQLSKTVPIFLYEANGHIAHANSAAFARVGISNKTPDPQNGRYIKDNEGNLTGEIQEVPAISPFFQIGDSMSLE